MAWKLGKKGKRILAILATIFLPVIGIGLAAAIGQEIGSSVAGAAGSRNRVILLPHNRKQSSARMRIEKNMAVMSATVIRMKSMIRKTFNPHAILTR